MYLQKINLKNKYALVTGAGKGLGRACSIALAESGATVFALSRTSSDLDKLQKEVKKIKGKIIKIHCDVMNYDDLKQEIEKIKVIDILVNNAGTNIPEPFEKIKQTSMNYLVDLNLKAAFNVAQLVVKKMLKNNKRPGSIINMSSQLGHVGMSGRNIYNMTKFGIEGLTKGMGVELAKNNIRVNTVAPTFVATPMVKKFFKNKKFKKHALRNIPMGKLASESDIATTVCFLASSASSMITGTSIVIDGGWTAQ
ncbi:SDR family NAD(P)-dependent oxidoreductase [Candidatus Pelagibacter sp.]|jgi:NAD(P)-dependent dehydrogenase (short-subunit alcohol dehydrogenase family)|nr:SDR family NAD(P)-dependent oxidoreductase [Candidatus Pelagibacter sp.]